MAGCGTVVGRVQWWWQTNVNSIKPSEADDTSGGMSPTDRVISSHLVATTCTFQDREWCRDCYGHTGVSPGTWNLLPFSRACACPAPAPAQRLRLPSACDMLRGCTAPVRPDCDLGRLSLSSGDECCPPELMSHGSLNDCAMCDPALVVMKM
jgi:hypothetical protein